MAPQPQSAYAGLGYGAVKRHRQRALKRDIIQGITKPDIRRLARRGGVKRIQVEIYQTTREALKKRLTEIVLEQIIQKVVLLLDFTGTTKNPRRTVSTLDIVYVLRQIGAPLYEFHQVNPHAANKW